MDVQVGCSVVTVYFIFSLFIDFVSRSDCSVPVEVGL